MKEKNISQEFRLIKYRQNKKLIPWKNEMMGKKHKKVCVTLNYIEHFLILPSKSLNVFRFLILLLCLVFLYKLPDLQ